VLNKGHGRAPVKGRMVTRSLIVHGGAWDIPDDLLEAHRVACRVALLAGWSILQSGGHALDAVEAAIRSMEDDPTLNAGTGAVLNAQGEVQLDASLMEGEHLKAGAVAAVQGIKNPISVARLVVESENVLLVAEGALRFAREAGIEECDNESLIVERERKLWQAWRKESGSRLAAGLQAGRGDTVGCVALDERGTIAAGNSSGGRPFKHPGRVGDCPLVGCGIYADNLIGGAACTGVGEDIIRVVMAKFAVDLLKDGETAREAAARAVSLLKGKVDGRGGLILVDRAGEIGFAFNTVRMAYAYLTEGMGEPVVGV
jgi:beta-aspartyl-peptidase (threonine type)